MNEKEKSLELAKLMGWRVHVYDTHVNFDGGVIDGVLQPYEKSKSGLAQFGAIELQHKKVMMRFAFDLCDDRWLDSKDGELFHGEPTQENILDEILKLHGVKL